MTSHVYLTLGLLCFAMGAVIRKMNISGMLEGFLYINGVASIFLGSITAYKVLFIGP